MTRRPVWVGLAGLLVISGCRAATENTPPVATPTVTLERTRAALGSPVDMTYQFAVAPGAHFDGDYRVFVHFLDADGELMWTDDHDPPRPTSQWQPGQTVQYTRTLFVPIYPYVGEASIEIGLHSADGQRRLPLAATDRGQRSYRVATLTVLPQTENIFLIYKDGWHAPEVAADNVAIEWHWTKREATIAFRNPKRDCMFFLHVDGKPKLLAEPQRVTVRLGDQPIAEFRLESPEEIIKRIPLAASQMGTGDMIEIRIAVDKTFVPAELPGGRPSDTRELGVRVFHAFVEPK